MFKVVGIHKSLNLYAYIGIIVLSALFSCILSPLKQKHPPRVRQLLPNGGCPMSCLRSGLMVFHCSRQGKGSQLNNVVYVVYYYYYVVYFYLILTQAEKKLHFLGHS